MKITSSTTARNLSSIPPPNPKINFRLIHIISSIGLGRTALFSTTCSRAAHVPAVKCNQNGSQGSVNGGSLKDVMSGLVDERVEQLLKKEENRDLLEGLEQASRRVEIARRELAEIEKQEIEAKIMRGYINHLESKAAEVLTFYFDYPFLCVCENPSSKWRCLD